VNQTRDEKSAILMVSFASNMGSSMYDHELQLGWAPVEDDTRWAYLMGEHVEVRLDDETVD